MNKMYKFYITIKQGDNETNKIFVARTYDEAINLAYSSGVQIEEMIDLLHEKELEDLKQITDLPLGADDPALRDETKPPKEGENEQPY